MTKRYKHISLISGLYYHVALSILAVAFVVIGYWQIQEDKTIISVTEMSVISSPGNRGFTIPISLCNNNVQEFQIERYYLSLDEKVYYTVPSSTYLAPQEDMKTGCYSTALTAFTGSLAPGEYEYRIFVSYNINPIQSRRSLAALVHVTVE